MSSRRARLIALLIGGLLLLGLLGSCIVSTNDAVQEKRRIEEQRIVTTSESVIPSTPGS